MKKIFQLALLGIMGAFMVSCNEDYKDWATSQTSSPESAVTIPGYQASAVSPIDLKQVTTDQVALFTLNSATLPDGFELKDARIELSSNSAGKANTVNTTIDGKADKKEVKTIVESVFGKDPIARTFAGHVYASALKDGQAVLIDAGSVDVTITPPGLSESYKLVINDGEVEYPLANDGSTPYDDPNFTGSITTTLDNSTWQVVAANGEVIASGKIENPGKYLFSVNVKSGNCNVNKAPEYLYMKGHANGWDGYDPLECTNDEGTQFRGFMYLDQEGFKFTTKTDWSGTNYGADFSTDGGAGNLVMKEKPGYYEIKVDLEAKKYTLTEIESIGIVGDATPTGWGSDTKLTYNPAEQCWEIKGIQLTEGKEYKFRANDAWDYQWGYDSTKKQYVFDGNAPAAKCAETGTYDIKLWAYVTGFAKCEMTKK